MRLFDNQKKLILDRIEQAAHGHVSGLFGYRLDPLHPADKTLHMHNGLDIGVVVGTPLYMPHDGVLLYTGNDVGKDPKYPKGLNGNYIRLALTGHPEIEQISFAHLSKFGKTRPGESVHKDEVFAYTGNTGESSGPHVHIVFWKRLNGALTPVDPLPYLAAEVGVAEIPTRPEF